MRLSFHRFSVWIALFAVLFAAVSPVAAAVRYLSDPIAFAEICHAAAADSQETPAPQSGTVHQAHCIFCISGAWQAPTVSVLVIVARRVSELVLPVEDEAFRPYDSTAFSPSNPRAPPRLT